jgi:hypothetical protein
MANVPVLAANAIKLNYTVDLIRNQQKYYPKSGNPLFRG